MWRKGLTLSATFLLAIFLIVSCKKKNQTIGGTAINQNELLSSGGIDAFSIVTYSVNDGLDSLVTSETNTSVLGSYNDPVFGKVNGEIYTQLKLSSPNPVFAEGVITIDSVVLGMQYAGYYGNSGDQNIEVYEIHDPVGMFADSSYLASDEIGELTFGASTNLVYTDENPFGSTTNNIPDGGIYYLSTGGLTVIGDDTLSSSQLRIHLKREFGMKFITEAKDPASTTFDSNEDFFEYFKGLHIKTNNTSQSSGQGGMFYFDLKDTYSKMSIYYKIDGVTKTPFDLLINSETATFTHMNVDHSGTVLADIIADSTLGENQYYAQAYGTRAIIQIESLVNLPTNVIIHKATLDLPIQYQTGTKYAPSSDMVATTILEPGKYGFYSFVPYDSYNKRYQIDLRAYVQAVVNKEIENTGIAISPALFVSSVDRIIFNGKNSTNKDKPRLNIVYTEF